ncbi:hypothetical protein EDE05_11442 [Neorhizobium sp. R1-B]|uniref:hypothetical protein n=1 Tax=Neorhizobium sp. R1-B TaxID=2485162 RepID=UPI001064FA5A|nr:hypothetical protein [Neorhizobium sp. R1-B]TDX77733.1 hypothetical protein EDE05_11442 [Neorhizobium sp. R1-B]
MVSGIDLAETGINRLVRSLLADGVRVREVNTMLMLAAVRRLVDEAGEDLAIHVLKCMVNQIEEGAYRSDYIAPEYWLQTEHPAKPVLTIIEGGGGSKV